LRTLEFSLKKLLHWLDQADFVETPERCCIQTHGLDISCTSLRLTNRQPLQPAVRPPKKDEDESMFSLSWVIDSRRLSLFLWLCL
jgi:hypothetical protein